MDKEIDNKSKVSFWNKILLSAGTQPKTPQPIRGASGQYHKVLGIGVDEENKRIILVSGEHDARSAVLTQYDIQSYLSEYKIVTLRPAVISVSKVAQAIKLVMGSPELNDETLKIIVEDKQILDNILNPSMGSIKSVFDSIKIDALPQILQLIQQLAEIKIEPADIKGDSKSKNFKFNFSNLVDNDPLEKDREYGICAVPLYDFLSKEIELINSSKSIDDVAEILIDHGIYQFIYPAADNLALGLIDRGVKQKEELNKQISSTESLGHPFGDLDIIQSGNDIKNLIEILEEKDYVIEGEYGFELSEKGKSIRFEVKYKPKEGIVSKLINRFKVNIDIKNIIGTK